MAAYAQTSGRLASLFPNSSSTAVDCHLDGQVDSGADPHSTVSINYQSGDHATNCFGTSSDAQVCYLSPEKGRILDAHRNVDPEDYYVGGQINMEGFLDITIHHAHDIQNICIYGNQDVYAKFSTTHCQDAVYSTHPVRAGGKNPIFNQSLQIPVSQVESVLKCEIWMMSCARTYLEDQLLGFALVPLASLFGKGKKTQDYALTSTDLFHTPAGKVCLSLLFHCQRSLIDPSLLETHGKMLIDNSPDCSSPNMSEVMLMDCGGPPTDYNKIEFPDLQVASENQHMVSMYLKMACGNLKLSNGEACSESKLGDVEGGMVLEHQDISAAPLLQLGSVPIAGVDCEMALNAGEEKFVESVTSLKDCNLLNLGSPCSDASCVETPSSSPLVLTIPSATEEENSQDSQEPSISSSKVLESPGSHMVGGAHTTGSSGSVSSTADGPGCTLQRSDDSEKERRTAPSHDGKVATFNTPLVSISLEPEEPVVQQQIVDMYMKSFQQFTESLAKMKLPLDVDVQGRAEPHKETEQKGSGKKEGHRVFYGSRAFF